MPALKLDAHTVELMLKVKLAGHVPEFKLYCDEITVELGGSYSANEVACIHDDLQIVHTALTRAMEERPRGQRNAHAVYRAWIMTRDDVTDYNRMLQWREERAGLRDNAEMSIVHSAVADLEYYNGGR